MSFLDKKEAKELFQELPFCNKPTKKHMLNALVT